MKYSIKQFVLMAMRKVVRKIHPRSIPIYPRVYGDDEVSAIVTAAIDSEKPYMVSRFGAVEIEAVYNYLGIAGNDHSWLHFVCDKIPAWWWNEGTRRCMTDNAGFFPNTNENLERFGALMLKAMAQIDILISWQGKERLFDEFLRCKQYINYIQIDPFWAKHPWTEHLEGKKVLVVHPFADEIASQYARNREKLFDNPNVLPPFDLKVFKAVQSIGGKSEFKDWFEALQYMEDKISQIDFDVCLLGCGAYGMPLAAFIKERLHKGAIHIGGSLQLLFGIKGSRWENPMYGVDVSHMPGRYAQLPNEWWVRPNISSQVEGAEKVDNGCYW